MKYRLEKFGAENQSPDKDIYKFLYENWGTPQLGNPFNYDDFRYSANFAYSSAYPEKAAQGANIGLTEQVLRDQNNQIIGYQGSNLIIRDKVPLLHNRLCIVRPEKEGQGLGTFLTANAINNVLHQGYGFPSLYREGSKFKDLYNAKFSNERVFRIFWEEVQKTIELN